ncbi:unnamed protein product, partial [Protopolystoma xenopodis]
NRIQASVVVHSADTYLDGSPCSSCSSCSSSSVAIKNRTSLYPSYPNHILNHSECPPTKHFSPSSPSPFLASIGLCVHPPDHEHNRKSLKGCLLPPSISSPPLTHIAGSVLPSHLPLPPQPSLLNENLCSITPPSLPKLSRSPSHSHIPIYNYSNLPCPCEDNTGPILLTKRADGLPSTVTVSSSEFRSPFRLLQQDPIRLPGSESTYQDHLDCGMARIKVP